MEHQPTKIGRYIVKEELGRGRWGIVYRAHDPELNRSVALKRILLADEAQRERWRREAQATASLSHPHIVPIYDVIQTDDAAYIVTELLAGGTLRQRLTTPFAWQEGVSLLLPLCDAIAYAHQQGIIHRDIKPENILFSDSGVIKLVDFGLAYVIGESRLTRSGGMVGTPCYAAPEQIRGKPVDGRADVFALATVLYEILTGQPIFIGDTLQVIHQITQDEPVTLSPLQEIVPSSFLENLARALTKNPADRYTADEFGAALRYCLDQSIAHTDEAPVPSDIPSLLTIQPEQRASIRYATTYRADETRQVMDWIKAGQSGCLVGLRGAGKSNFLHFLLREDVRRHYLGRDHVNFTFVLIDLLALTECTDWAVHELILDRLLDQLRQLRIEEGVIEEMASHHWDALRSRDSLAAQRTIERCVSVLCEKAAQRLILLFDEFDAAFRTLDPSLFRCLRAIRDAHRGQVSYVVVVADDLACLRDDLTEVEHFYRLVSRNTCGLGPYDEADARQMIRCLASRRSVELGAEDTARLVELSGGHAGLLKATLSLLWDAHQEGSLAEIAPALKDEPAARAECQKVWNSLSESEQAALCALVGEAQADPQILRRLKLRGLVREGQSGALIFSPLFADFVRQQMPPSPAGTVISRSPRIVQIEGRRIKGLSELEFEALYYFYKRKGEICTKDELIENIYHQQYDRKAGGIDDARLQALIFRLRKKIEPDRKRPRYIVTVRGEGYKFVEPDGR